MAVIVEEERRNAPITKLPDDLPLLMREQVRRQRDRTFVTWFLSTLDTYLMLGTWYFRRMTYERRYDDGSVTERSEVRRTLAGYTISWGLSTFFYEDGTLMSKQPLWDSAFCRGLTAR